MDVRVEGAGGTATACLCNADAEAVPETGRRVSLAKGAEFRGDARDGAPFEPGWISPAAAETLFVKEEMAQPAHDAVSLGWGVLICSVVEFDVSAALGGGNTVSGIVDANLRTLWR